MLNSSNAAFTLDLLWVQNDISKALGNSEISGSDVYQV